MNLPWGDLEVGGFTHEEMMRTMERRRNSIKKEYNPFALFEHEQERKRKAAILRAFFVDHHDGYPPAKCKTEGCECIRFTRNFPPHFSVEDESYCCSVCRTSKGRKHGGVCQGE